MAFQYPWGNLQELNLTWYINQFKKLREDWATAEAGIDGALDAEIQRAEDAMSDVFTARDAAAASATAAGNSASAAALSATAAQNSASAAASSATLANNKATAAGLSEAAAAQSASQAALSASNAGNAATQAGNSATAAGNSATAAGNSATAAGNSATAAAGSASAAAISETNAAASAQRAEDAAASASAGGVVKSIENVPIASIDDALDENVVELVVGIEPVQSGTGDPTPDNVRPITGWTGANVKRAGINIFDPNNLESLTMDYQEPAVTRLGHRFTKPGQYAIKAYGTGSTTGYLYARRKFADGTWGGESYVVASQSTTPYIITIDAGMELYVYDAQVHTADEAKLRFNEWQIQVAYRDTQPAEYNAYTGATYEISFPIEAGTVYGGTLTNEGENVWKLAIKTAKVIYQSISGTVEGNGFRIASQYNLDNIKSGYGYIVSNLFSKATTYQEAINSIDNAPNKIAYNSYGQILLNAFINNQVITDIAVLNNYIANAGGLEIVYEIATPVEYTITTAEAITLLAGYNNVWANTGIVDLLRYYADSKVYIDAQDALVKALIAKELDDMIADTALTANDFRIVNNTLYRITAPVASGATLTPGTNCEATTIAAVLKTLLT